MFAAGCSGGDDAVRGVTAGSTCENDGDAGPYFLVGNRDWRFKEAIDYPEDGALSGGSEPSLDWYAEYERFTPPADDGSFEGVSLRMSGHHAALDEHLDELRGFDPTEREIDGTRAFVGTGPDGAPTVVTVAVVDDYTLMLLSYGLDLEELTDAAAVVERVCQPAWVEAGGQVLDCLPTEPGCGQDPAPPPPPASTSSVPVVQTTEDP